VRDEPCPRFRQDLVVRRVVESGEVGYTIRDPLSGDYYRQHPMTRELCLLLDGERTPPEVLTAMGAIHVPLLARLPRGSPLNRSGAWTSSRTPSSATVLIERGRVERRGLWAESSERAQSTRHRRPLALFRRIHPYVRHLHAACGGSRRTFAFARPHLRPPRGSSRTTRAAMFTLQSATPLHLLILYLALFSTIKAHEFGLGCAVTTHGGGRAPRAPPHVFHARNVLRRFDTYFFGAGRAGWPLGTYVEMRVSLATFVWLPRTPIPAPRHAYRVMLFAGISGFIFNMNPLIKLDGYYVLMSWLTPPARALVRVGGGALRSLFTRDMSEVPPATRRERRITVYGLASMTCSILILTVVLRFCEPFVGNFHEAGSSSS
jgi:putative peptide zinc metalloprotease protein